jgi:hypothetical protein
MRRFRRFVGKITGCLKRSCPPVVALRLLRGGARSSRVGASASQFCSNRSDICRALRVALHEPLVRFSLSSAGPLYVRLTRSGLEEGELGFSAAPLRLRLRLLRSIARVVETYDGFSLAHAIAVAYAHLDDRAAGHAPDLRSIDLQRPAVGAGIWGSRAAYIGEER